jgi:hypothetical protein
VDRRLQSIKDTLSVFNAPAALSQTDVNSPKLAHGDPPFKQYQTQLDSTEEVADVVNIWGQDKAENVQGLPGAWPEMLLDAVTVAQYYDVKIIIASLIVTILCIFFIWVIFIDLYTMQDIAI